MASRQLSREERAQRDAAYRVDVQGFGDVLNTLIGAYNALAKLNQAVGQLNQGQALAVPVTDAAGQQSAVIFNRRHLRSANAEFGARIRQLKSYFRISMRKTKKLVSPSSFSSVFAPVYASATLRAFFQEGAQGFGPVDPRVPNSPALIDSLPNAKNGYLMRNTSTLLFFAYAHNRSLLDPNNGQLARADAVMDAVFGGVLPAAAVPLPRGAKEVTNKKGVTKTKNVFEAVPMSIAVRQGAITAPVNTYQALGIAYPAFNKDSFKTVFFQNMASYNYYTRNMLVTPGLIIDPEFTAQGPQQPQGGLDPVNVLAGLDDDNLRAAMLQEHELATNASLGWKAIHEPAQKAERARRKKESDASKRAQGIKPGRQARPRGIVELPPLGR